MTTSSTYYIGTRSSELAIKQTRVILKRLARHAPDLDVEMIQRKTVGDQFGDRSIHDLPGKGFFTRDLDEAVLHGDLDAAVHSAKDVPVDAPEGLRSICFVGRSYPGDVLVSSDGNGLEKFPEGATIGTSSLRRRAQVLSRRPNLQVTGIRGNVDTRLDKLRDQEELDGLILAEAGLHRLNLEDVITERLSPSTHVPAPGQGVLLVQTGPDENKLTRALSKINNDTVAYCMNREREMIKLLDGGCRIPLGVFCRGTFDNGFSFRAMVATPNGDTAIHVKKQIQKPSQGKQIVNAAAEELKKQGASNMIKEARERLQDDP